MQANSDVQTGRFLWFLITAGVAAEQTVFDGWDAFVVAGTLWLIAWLAVRLAGSATSRLGGTAWFLLVQLAALFSLFLWLVPLAPIQNVLILWGIAIPLVFAGGIARRVCDRWPVLVVALHRSWKPMLALAGIVFILALLGVKSLPGALVITGVLVLPAVPLFYGWHLGARPATPGRDARFAEEDEFQRIGVAHDL